jgi:hypothetical protein
MMEQSLQNHASNLMTVWLVSQYIRHVDDSNLSACKKLYKTYPVMPFHIKEEQEQSMQTDDNFFTCTSYKNR